MPKQCDYDEVLYLFATTGVVVRTPSKYNPFNIGNAFKGKSSLDYTQSDSKHWF
ncbi:MAG: hypothetical protein HKM04_01125 [Legionellales bacterium]|nr:hypothetical protein [Legionellales bacterium]